MCVCLGTDTVDHAVSHHTGVASLSGNEGRQWPGAQVAVVAAAVRRRGGNRRGTAVHDDAAAGGDGTVVWQQRDRTVQNVWSGAGHRAGHGHVSDIQRHQRARGVRVHGIRTGPRLGQRDDDGGRVRGHAGPDGPDQ